MDDERKDGEQPSSETSATENKSDKSELPATESPPLSPAGEPAETPAEAEAPAAATAAETPMTAVTLFSPPPPQPQPESRSSRKRQALMAASVALAAAFGAVIGALAWQAPPSRDVVALEERKAMQHSIAHLTKQVALLKTNLEMANKAAHAQVAGISERLTAAHAQIASLTEKLETRAAPDITGSIPKPAETPQSAETPQAAQAQPVPMPRPAPRIAAADSRPAVVPGWRVVGVRAGYVYVTSHGDIFQVMPGVPLPGLGPVRAIRHQDGRWVVVTPRGNIVSMRYPRRFE
jgi:hypothetical protein